MQLDSLMLIVLFLPVAVLLAMAFLTREFFPLDENKKRFFLLEPALFPINLVAVLLLAGGIMFAARLFVPGVTTFVLILPLSLFSTVSMDKKNKTTIVMLMSLMFLLFLSFGFVFLLYFG